MSGVYLTKLRLQDAHIMRLFAAIRPPKHIIHHLSRIQKGIPGAKWSPPEKLHITLGYFGEVNDEQAEMLDHELALIRMGGFDIRLKGAGHYGRSEPHAVWIGVEPSKELNALHKHCRRAARYCKIDMEKRVYHPHVTLAYLRREPNVERIAAFEKRHVAFETRPFLTDQFFLFSSLERKNRPNEYRKEASYPLLG